ncbi:magnesium and cobalt transport protein CorA [Pengzhenrongella frigida]|uniref:Magnesium and cobalt transport protein CorA n=1 Tax=Pengzhenrongella frigida TaxID=1259133 RepID=A0A4Q5N1C0_9MICO|nr:magnesium and cobalt transport protein CorA [Cellulomonas sp. HLT2-17]RYV51855.1 magnesium and cobalt transport protein CorA [Cellulomonas sp. HLT2-17]
MIVDCALYVKGQTRHARTDITAALREARAGGGFVWIGLFEPTAAEFAEISEDFTLPTLAVDDAVRAHQRPKLERYGDVTFAVVKPGRYVDHEEVVEISELAIFLGEHFVITVRHGVSDVPAAVRAELNTSPALLAHGPAAVLYRALDLAVDGYLDVVEAIGIDIDEIEEQVFGDAGGEHSERIYKLKSEVLEFRRAVVPLAVPLQRLVAGEVPWVGAAAQPYFRDVHDHLLRAADAIEAYDHLLTNVLAANLAQVTVEQSRVTVRQNEDMRKISSWAAIALVPTAIAGIYGMNFEYMPELSMRYGYFVVIAVIAAICVGLHALFRRNDWL